MNKKIAKFWSAEGEIWAYRTGNRSNYRVDYIINGPHKLIATEFTANKDTVWMYYWNGTVLSEEKMVKITELKAFM